MFPLHRDAPQSLSDQVLAGMRALIAAGQWPTGARLPSIRQLAQHLGVSLQTVISAYDKLVAAGDIDSRGTAGFFVSERAASALTWPDAELLEAGQAQEPVWLAQQANDQRAGVLQASSGALPASWLEDAVPAAALQRGLARSSAGMASRCPPQGLPELRERLALLLRGQGIPADAGRVMTTYGGSQAIDLICRAFVQPGDTVLVENPGYFLMFGRLRDAGVRLLPITRRPDGLDLDELEAACRLHRPRLLFLQAALHNPTGWGSSPANLHRVLVLAQQHGLLVAEDDVQGHFHPGSPTRLAALAGLGEGLIYYSSFSKALSPALRMGYLAAAPSLLKPLLREKIHTVLTTPALNEYVLLELLSSGRWRKHLERLQRRLVEARHATARLLSEAGMRFGPLGEGGLFLWGQVPEGVDLDALVQAAWREKLLLARGATFRADAAADPHLRFNAVFSQQPRLAQFLAAQFAQHQQALQRAGQALAGARGRSAAA